MNMVTLSRWQFGITTVYHFLMVPLTIGLGLTVAYFQTRWYRSGDEAYLRLTKFFGKLFLINFAMGVVTGIVQEFQFGMNWARYSRFVGDVFGAPLAMEALVAFFLESTFLGLWIFGWDRLSPRAPPRHHLGRGHRRRPLGVLHRRRQLLDAAPGRRDLQPRDRPGRADRHRCRPDQLHHARRLPPRARRLAADRGRVRRRDLGLAAHAGPADAGRGPHALHKAVRTSIYLTFAMGIAVAVSGDYQAKLMFEQQPMKMAAAEALCETEQPAGLSVFAVGDVSAECDVRTIVIPRLLSFMATGTFDGEVQGVKDINAQYREQFGPGDYRPNLVITYWSFRAMIGFGAIASFGAVVAWWKTRKGKELPTDKRWLRVGSIAIIATPFIANATGWIFTEMGRQPWVVAPNPDGIPEIRLMTANASSPSVSSAMVITTLVGFTLLYGALLVVEIFLLRRYVSAGPEGVMPYQPPERSPDDPGGGSDDGTSPSDDREADVLAFAY